MKLLLVLLLILLLPVLFPDTALKAAEARIAIAPHINLPKDLPLESEELSDFYGTQLFILKSAALRARAEVQLGQKLPVTLILEARQIPQTSIISISASGVDESLASSFLSALIDQYLKAKREAKKQYYQTAIAKVDAALTSAPKDVVPDITAYKQRLIIASFLDTEPTFERFDY
jgi:hypothetical protein